MATFLILLFTILPALELALLIKVGTLIGASTTMMLLLLSGTAGVALARHQGFHILRDIQTSLQQGIMPGDAMIDGLLILIGGLLLLIPGFITDVFGLILLIPIGRRIVRSLLKHYFLKRYTPTETAPPRQRSRLRDIEDADFRELS